MSKKNVIKIKIFALGETCVGKTCYIIRYTEDTFKEQLTTTGIDLKIKKIIYNKKKYDIEFYDTAGQEKFRSLSANSIKSAEGIILIFDLTNQKSYDQITTWMADIKDMKGDNFPIILIGNKCDLEDERIISNEEGIELSKKYKLKYFETSCKTGVNIKESAAEIIKQIIEMKEKKLKEALRGFELIENFQLKKSKTLTTKKKKKNCSN